MLLTHTAIRKSRTAFILMLLVLAGGMISYIEMPRELNPEVVVPYFQVSAYYEGAAPETVENLIAIPIEKEISSVEGVKNIYTYCYLGGTSITIEFDVSADLNKAFGDLKDAVDIAEGNLPGDMKNSPFVRELDFSDEDVMILSVNGDAPSAAMQLVADELKDYIENVPGVREVVMNGEVEYELEVTVDPAKLALYNVSLPGLVQTFTGENENRPGGSVEIGPGTYNITIPGQFDSFSDVSNLILTVRGNNPVYLRDVAEVGMKQKEPYSLARVNGNDSISLSVKNRAGSDLVAISDAVRVIVEEAEKKIPPSVYIDVPWDNSQWINMMLSDLESSVVTGFLFLAIIILLFLGWRNSIFVGIAIPFSLLLSFLILARIGYTMNTMVMASMIVGLGMLVDNAIVIVENSYRHMEEGLSARAAVETAVTEVGWPMITSTLTTVLAFLPLAFWPGIIGKFFIYFPVTLMIVLTASLIVALVVNPVVCAHFMKLKSTRSERDEDWALARIYRKWLPWIFSHTKLVMIAVFVYFFGSIALFAVWGNGSIMFPESEQPPWITVNIEAPPGSTLDYTEFYARQVEAAALEFEDVETVEVSVSPQSASVNMILKEYHLVEMEPSEIIRQIRDRFRNTAGIKISIDSPSMGPPVSEGVTLEMRGSDVALLQDAITLTEEILSGIEGVEDITNNQSLSESEFLVEVDRDKALLMAVPTNVIAATIRSFTDGYEIGTFTISGDDEIDVVARLPQDQIQSVNDLRTLMIPSNKGGQIPLGSVANIFISDSSGDIQRTNQERLAQVEAAVVGRNTNEVLAEFFQIAETTGYPGGYRPTAGGEAESEQETSIFFMKAFAVAVLLIFIVLVAQFDSLVQALIVMSSVALSTAGVVLSLFILRQPFTIIMNGITIISLAGVAVNNAIVLIDYTNQLRREGLSLNDAVLKAGVVRLRPVLLTALTTMAGMIPMALGISLNVRNLSITTGSPTGEWWKPMGQSMIAGLFFATFLTLIIVPTLYRLFEGMKESRRARRQARAAKRA